MKRMKTKKKSIIAIILTMCITLGLVFMGYGEIVIKAEETESTAHSLSNPVRDADGSVTWDCVWFGSYPQTEIVSEEDKTQLAAMEEMNTYYETKYEKVSASAYQQIAGADYNSNGDATVNGVKYRRMKKGDASYSMTNDNYYQWTDSESYHYFRHEPIKWRVLSVEENDTFLLADTGLDERRYNESQVSITWETCTMRSWLNGYSATSNKEGKDYSSNNFLDTAFDSAEQAAILNSEAVNADNPECETAGENNMTEKVFLLSIDEASKAEYGFSINKCWWDKARKVKTSTYAKAMGCWSNTDAKCAGNVWWWLRLPDDSHATASVMDDGYLYYYGHHVSNDGYTVRPALHLNLSQSSLYSYAGTVRVEKTTDEEELGHVSGGENEGGNSSTTTEKVTTTTQASSGTTTTQASSAATTTQASSGTTTNQQPQSTTAVTKIKVIAPDKVKGVTLSRAGSGKLKVSYKKVKDAKGYQISYSTNKHFSNAKKLTVKNTKYTIKKLKKGKTYYVRVRAYKLDGSKKVYGKWSGTKKIKVK